MSMTEEEKKFVRQGVAIPTVALIIMVILFFILNLNQEQRISRLEHPVTATAENMLEGYTEECVKTTIVEKYRVIEPCLKTCNVFEKCDVGDDEKARCYKLSMQELDCLSYCYYENKNSISTTRPYLEFYNETVCIEYGLRKKVK